MGLRLNASKPESHPEEGNDNTLCLVLWEARIAVPPRAVRDQATRV